MERVRKVRLTRRNRNRKDDLQLQFPVGVVRDMGWKYNDEFVLVVSKEKDMVCIARVMKGGE